MVASAFVLSLLAVILSLASLAWQLTSFFLSGPRITVQLLHGVASSDGDRTFVWSLPAGPRDFINDPDVIASTRELVAVRVRNHGRAAVKVTSAGIGAGHLGLLKNDIYAVSLKREYVKLEPGDFFEWRADVWPLVDLLRKQRSEDELVVRAVAELATLRRAFSPKKETWRVKATDTSVVPGRPPGVGPVDRDGPDAEARKMTSHYSGWRYW